MKEGPPKYAIASEKRLRISSLVPDSGMPTKAQHRCDYDHNQRRRAASKASAGLPFICTQLVGVGSIRSHAVAAAEGADIPARDLHASITNTADSPNVTINVVSSCSWLTACGSYLMSWTRVL